MIKYAIVYICSGGYHVFWEPFHKTCEQYFLPDASKEYFVFTDDRTLLETKTERVHTSYCKHMGWPYDVLMKWADICSIQDKLVDFDYIILINANVEFRKEIPSATFELSDLTICSFSKEGDDSESMTFERNEASMACIPYGTPTKKYYSSRFIVGKAALFLEMSRTLRDWTATDLSHGIIPVWHDESMANAYVIKNEGKFSISSVGSELIAIEEQVKDGDVTCGVYVNKDRYGGAVGVRYNKTLGMMDIYRRKVTGKISRILHGKG